MKKYDFYILRLLSVSFLLSLSACGADEADSLSNGVDITERPLAISAQLGMAVTTRDAITTTTQLEEGSIGIYRKTTNGYDALNNVPYSWDGISNSWKSEDETDRAKTLYVGNRFADVYAYYPYEPSQGSSSVFNLVMRRYYNQGDAMYYAKTTQVNNSAAQANFIMKSPYSRITFQIKNNNMSDCFLKDFKISFVNKINALGSIDISADNPTVTGQFSIESYDFELSDSDPIYDTGIATGETNDKLDLLMIPQTMHTMTITVQLALNDMDLNTIASVTIPSNAFSNKLEQGKQYIVPLMIQGAAIVFDNKEVPILNSNPDEDPYNDKEITAYTLPPVELSNTLTVATGNLYYYVSQIIDPEKNPNYEKDGENRWYGFAARNGQMFPERHSTPVNTFTYSTSMDDFCERVGSNWKMPTRAQLQELATLANNYSSSGTCDDDGNTVDGWWIGNASSSSIPPTTSRPTDAIFLTAGNYLDSNGGYLVVPSGSSGPITYTSNGNPPADSFIRCVINR